MRSYWHLTLKATQLGCRVRHGIIPGVAEENDQLVVSVTHQWTGAQVVVMHQTFFI